VDTIDVGDGSLEYRVRGEGPPVVFVHGSVFADPWEEMLRYGDLVKNFQVVTYRRRGHGGSSASPAGRALAGEAADLLALLDGLDIERAHVVGHSLAADIVLQAVLDSPQRFMAMVLLEPGLFSVNSAQGFDTAMRPVFDVFESGNHHQAMLLFLGGPGGAELLARLEPLLPEGATELALADVPTLFGSDIPAGSAWKLDEEATRQLGHPALLALGSDTGPIFRESNAVLRDLLANAQHVDVPDSGHFVHLEQAEFTANAIAGFLTSHAAG